MKHQLSKQDKTEPSSKKIKLDYDIINAGTWIEFAHFKWAMKVYNDELLRYRQTIDQRLNGIKKISKPKYVIYDSNNYNNKQYCWSHFIPDVILQNIFEMAISMGNPWEYYCPSTLMNMIKTCKSWRNVIMNINGDNNNKLFKIFWKPFIKKYMGKDFDLSEFILLPDEYKGLIQELYICCMADRERIRSAEEFEN